MFYVGQKVVCIHDTITDPEDGETVTVKGHVYTIRSIDDFSQWGVGLRFEEIINPTVTTSIGRIERAFNARGFRPIVETDISVFTQILDDVNTRAPAPASASAINLEEGR